MARLVVPSRVLGFSPQAAFWFTRQPQTCMTAVPRPDN
jgi:hypothetical protein